MKVLFIGGTGIISSACSTLAVKQGMDVYLLNRGRTSHRPIPVGAKVLYGDIRDRASAVNALGDHTFDVVIDWVAYTPDHIATDLTLFSDRAGQFVFISSASAYQKPPVQLPITEDTPLDNPFWQYSRNKIACEAALLDAYRQDDFPMTIVRPSHTYDRTLLPLHGGYTIIDRIRRGKPLLIHGDGTSLWTLTHHRDFARAFLGLLGEPRAIGEAYHITSDEWLTWNEIGRLLGQAVGVEAHLAHVPSETVARFDSEWGDSLLGDKSHCSIFDNSKIRGIVPGFTAEIPFSEGAREIVAWYDANPDKQLVNAAFDQMTDRIIAAQASVQP